MEVEQEAVPAVIVPAVPLDGPPEEWLAVGEVPAAEEPRSVEERQEGRQEEEQEVVMALELELLESVPEERPEQAQG